jgi:hypothetical protein
LKNLLPQNSAANPSTNKLAITPFSQFTGAYRDVATGSGLKVFLRDTVLMSEPNGRLIPLSSNAASIGRAKMIFSTSPRGLKLINAAGDTLTYLKTDTARTDVQYLTDYVGVYSSDETESRMSLVVKDGKLFSRLRSTDTPLTPVYKDGFSFPGGELFFERSKQGKVEKMFISVARARKVEFRRM